jgi:hypothetical protein
MSLLDECYAWCVTLTTANLSNAPKSRSCQVVQMKRIGRNIWRPNQILNNGISAKDHGPLVGPKHRRPFESGALLPAAFHFGRSFGYVSE